MNNIVLGRYMPYNSIIHRLDPRVKMVLMMALITITMINPARFIGYLVLGIFLLMIIGLSKIPFKFMMKALKPMIFMMSFLFIINLLLIREGEVLFRIAGFAIYDRAVIQTAFILIRVILLISFTTILTASTKPLDLTMAIEDLLSPLKRFKVPSHTIAMMISLALRFIPTLLEEAQRIMKAQASRGVDFETGSLKQKIMAIGSMIIPLFIASLQRAEDIANAMESRGYVPDQHRTRYHQLKLRYQDAVAIVVCVVVMGSLYFI